MGVTEAIEAIRAGKPVLLPTDTVYGLCATPDSEAAARDLYRLKGREQVQPTALVARDVATLVERVPELRGRSETIAGALLPGSYTLVLPNPAGRYPWLTGERPETIGVRVPELPDAAATVLAAVGCVLATSANLPGGPDPRRLGDVPAEIRSACAAEVDAGELPGTPSTVIDFTGPEPRVLREGLASSAEALERVRRLS